MEIKIRAIITGATGMVGEGVLHESLSHPDVESVLVLNRKPCGVTHPKLTEIVHKNFFNICDISEQLRGYNACFFCLGVSSIGLKANEYYSRTYILTMHIADILSSLNPDMTFCYVSGAGTDSTETGKLGWARVKGKTENDLMKLPFKKVYAFRPAFMLPEKNAKNAHKYYSGFRFLYPALHSIFPGYVSTLKVVANGMINSVRVGYEKQVLEVKDIIELANR
jgi:uncharacterized protein YbjT (DUF2867 family)